MNPQLTLIALMVASIPMEDLVKRTIDELQEVVITNNMEPVHIAAIVQPLVMKHLVGDDVESAMDFILKVDKDMQFLNLKNVVQQ